jgi:hypothetical protein
MNNIAHLNNQNGVVTIEKIIVKSIKSIRYVKPLDQFSTKKLLNKITFPKYVKQMPFRIDNSFTNRRFFSSTSNVPLTAPITLERNRFKLIKIGLLTIQYQV